LQQALARTAKLSATVRRALDAALNCAENGRSASGPALGALRRALLPPEDDGAAPAHD